MSGFSRKWIFLAFAFVFIVVQFSLTALADKDAIKITMTNFSLENDRFGRAWSLPNKDGEMTQWVDDQFGLDISYEYVADSNKWDQMTLWAASGDYPETFVYAAHAGVQNTGRNIKWANLDKYFNDQKRFPRLYEIKHKYPRALSMITSIDGGHVIAFPFRMNYKPGMPNPDDRFASGWYIRDDVLKAVGGIRPTTLDGFTKLLRAIKAKKLTAPNGRPLIPLLLPPADWYSEWSFFSMFGVNWAGLAKNGWYQFWGVTQQGYEAMKYVNGLYNEGLIDQEWVTQKEEMYQEKLRNGSAAVVVGWLNYPWIADIKKGGYGFTYTALPVPKVPGVSRPFPWNGLPGPDPDIVLYVTSKASDAACERLARLAEWGLSPEGARYLYLGASPDMVELKKSGPYKGCYWFKDEYSALDWYANGDTKAARIKFGVLPLNGPVSYTRKEMKVPNVLSDADKWAIENFKWINANNNIAYMGDVGPENIPDDLSPINTKVWTLVPPMIQRACILPPDQFNEAYRQAIAECTRQGLKKVCDQQWEARKKYLVEHNNGDLPKDYPYADFREDFK